IVPKDTHEEKLAVARSIPIKSIKRMGKYNPLATRPVNIVLESKGDTEYILEHKRHLGRGVFVDQEYGPETERERKYLRPILNAARRIEEYKGRCKLEGDTLVIQGKRYDRRNLYSLPENINGFQATSRSDGKTLAFFGELNPFSNFHPSNFTFSGYDFHSSEQMIQFMKASFFEDEECAKHIMRSDSPVECKTIARNIKNYDRRKWLTVAKELCDGGIREKFRQNPYLSKLLLSTGNQTLVEACNDTDWGSGVPLHGDRCLVPQTWYSQGLLGIILEETRSWLRDIKGENTEESPIAEHVDNNMETN
ncbi:MAG: NADAR family protein, partial [Proteobacteria bacterium]|nr:NADAR family protein [Pseudomonadota bacterium]